MKTVLIVFGTRPEAIKMCPLVNVLLSRKAFRTVVCVTGQHREMLHDVLKTFGVVPDYDLAIMQDKQTLSDITSGVLLGMERILDEVCPDLVLVHGDTSSAFSAALSCFYRHIPVGHVEAGLRTYDLEHPFPEEFNRRSISLISSLHFAPTELAKQHLLNESVNPDTVFVTGNTAIDALRTTIHPHFSHPELDWASDSRLVLITAHRRENIGEPMVNMFCAIRRVLDAHPDVKAVYPIHMNPKVRAIANEAFNGCNQIHLIEPCDSITFHNLMAHSYLILTDSGGIQEEAPALGKPVLVMRNTTERPEGVEAGTVRLVGTDELTVYTQFTRLLDDEAFYNQMATAVNPYGDGHACERIADILEFGEIR